MRRDHRFVLNSVGCFELAEWGGVMLDACPMRETDERCGGRGEDATLQIVVDDQLLAGASGPVPAGLLDRLGIASGATRSISTRYGPLALSNAAQGPRRSSLRPVALAGGATCGDVLVLRFAPDRATATVEITSRVMDRISQ